jgi:hypothetical protein
MAVPMAVRRSGPSLVDTEPPLPTRE